MNLVMSEYFRRALERLATKDKSQANLAKQAITEFLMNPAQPGFSFERLTKCKDPNFWSFRVTDNIRIIVHRTADTFTLCYVDRHDEAYQWASKRKFEAHAHTGAMQIVELRETVQEVTRVIEKTVQPSAFAEYDAEYLHALGVPYEWLDFVRRVSKDNLQELIGHLPDEAVERLLDLAEGRPVPRPMKATLKETEAYRHPDAQRRFRVIDNQVELRQALEFPWARWIIFLHPAQRSVVEKIYNGPAQVKGSAGTGKTVVALHRAAWLVRQYQDAQVLLTTFSRTLSSHLIKNANILLGDSPERKRIHIEHLHKVARDLCRDRFQAPTAKHLTTLLVSAREQVAGASQFSVSFLQSEWEIVVDSTGINSWEDYNAAPRKNRGTPLGVKQRFIVWKVIETLQRGLQREGFSTWNALCLKVAASLQNRPYTHVIADEIQDFGPAELRLIRALAPIGKNTILLCGDSGQRIYKPSLSLLGNGIDIRGRSITLKINYRTTQQIRGYADQLFTAEEKDADGESIVRDAVSILNGPYPEVKACSQPDDEVLALSEWLQDLIKDGAKPEEIGVFARTESILNSRGKVAVETLGIDSYFLSEGEEGAGGVALGTMHRAKGLEFKAVAVIGCDKDLLPLKSVLSSINDLADRAAFCEQERNLLYVALTRPRERLFVSYSGEPSSILPTKDLTDS